MRAFPHIIFVQVFFHKYFSQKSEKEAAKAEKVAKRKGASGASDDGDGDQTEGEGGNEVDAEEEASSAEEDEDNEEAEIWEVSGNGDMYSACPSNHYSRLLRQRSTLR